MSTDYSYNLARFKRIVNTNSMKGNNSNTHSFDEGKALESPMQLIMQTNRYNRFGDRSPDNVVAFVEYNASDKERVAIIEFDSDVDSEFVDETKGETEYHTVVTIFEPDTQRDGLPFDYAEELLSNPNNFELEIVEKQSVLSVTGEKHPNTKNELPSINNISNSIGNVKQKQLEIIQKTNPAPNEYSTWVRTVEDIKTLAETLEDDDWSDGGDFNPDLSSDDIQEAIEKGSITVYSSYPIENGVRIKNRSNVSSESNAPIARDYRNIASNGIISNDDGSVNSNYFASFDEEYISAVESGDTATAQRLVDSAAEAAMKDSKIGDSNRKLVKVYHGTEAYRYTY